MGLRLPLRTARGTAPPSALAGEPTFHLRAAPAGSTRQECYARALCPSHPPTSLAAALERGLSALDRLQQAREGAIMAISEESRHHLYLRLEEVLGSEEAATLMEHLPPVGWADVATKRDIDALRDSMKRDIDALRDSMKRDIDALRDSTKRDIEALRYSSKGDVEALRNHDIAEVKHDITGVKQDIVGVKRDVADVKNEIGALRAVVATREDLAGLRADIERELRGLTWRFITVLIAAVSIVIAGVKL